MLQLGSARAFRHSMAALMMLGNTWQVCRNSVGHDFGMMFELLWDEVELSGMQCYLDDIVRIGFNKLNGC